MASLNVCSSKSFPPHPFAFSVLFSLAFAASFLPPVFISILLNFSSYARGKCVLFCNLHFIGCHVFDIRSGHICFQGQYSAWVFSALFPFCLQCFLSFILCLGCISLQSFPCYSFSAAAPGISVLQGSLIPCRITGGYFGCYPSSRVFSHIVLTVPVIFQVAIP